MVWKIQIAALSVAAYAFMGTNAAAVTNYTSSTDPTKITIPDIPQTTSLDPAAECSWYSSPYTINAAEWPSSWTIATSNGMNTSKEFTALYNSIDWKSAPNIPVRKLSATGGLDMTGYDTATDPDCWWSATQCVKPKTAGINADIYDCPQPNTWGLTFDDGPNCSHNAFYDFLEEKKQKASMFYIGSNVLNWPYGALRGVKDGHHLCGHTWSHTLMTTLTNQEVLAELYYTTKAIKYVTGVTPLHWRPAQGDLDDRVRWIASQINLTAILWNLDTDDWAANVTPGITEDTVNENYQKFIAKGTDGTFANSGNIVLTHEINNMTMDFMIKHYPAIKTAYKNILDVATCQSIQYPYVEKSVSFTPFGGSASASGSAKASGSTKASGSASSAAQSSGQPTSAGSSAFTFNGSLFIAALFGLLVLA
ncbi:chitin deacetylase 1 [Phycomyces nitens]|nr:chitin deacetylase 1 [Phycomyces nitens]